LLREETGARAPIGALLAQRQACAFAPGDQGGTFNGNPLMCAVGLTVLETVLAIRFLLKLIGADPNNPSRMMIGNDGGVYISTTRGRQWAFTRLPIGQIYHVATDNRIPYFVYGQRQDDGSMRGPSQLPGDGGIHPAMWTRTARFRKGELTALTGLRARAMSSPSCSSEKGRRSAVPWISMNPPPSFMTTFMSVSHPESSP